MRPEQRHSPNAGGGPNMGPQYRPSIRGPSLHRATPGAATPVDYPAPPGAGVKRLALARTVATLDAAGLI